MVEMRPQLKHGFWTSSANVETKQSECLPIMDFVFSHHFTSTGREA